MHDPRCRTIPAHSDDECDIPELGMSIRVNVLRLNRRRCPICGLKRVLFKLTAFGDQAIGEGKARCAECAGFRV